MTEIELVTTGAAAKALGVDHSTLLRWRQQKLVTPDFVTAGGHARWDVARLRDQLAKLARE